MHVCMKLWLILKQVVVISSALYQFCTVCNSCTLVSFFRMTATGLRSICEVLDLERGGRKEDIVDRLINFLMKPKSSGKALPKSKKSMYKP